jgi:hypothetical protein
MHLSARYTCVVLMFLSVIAGVAEQRPMSGKQLREVQMFALQPDGSLPEISRETAAVDNEHIGTTMTATPGNTATFARLSGGKAKFRYTEGQEIRIIAQLPTSSDPRQIELHEFENRGMIRVSYLQAFGSRSDSSWNTHSFRARQLKDGRWLLEPALPLKHGEYCFSPKFSNANFCFGVDGK